MKKILKMMVVMLIIVSCIVSMVACSDSASPNDPCKQKDWDIIGVHPAIRGGDGITIEYYVVTAIDNEQNVHAVSVHPYEIEIVQNGTTKLDNNKLYITRNDFTAFINNQKTSVT